MNLYGNQSDVKAIAGLIYGVQPKDITSRPAGEDVHYGRGVFASSDKNCSGSKYNNKGTVNLQDVTTDASVVELEINGVTVSVTYSGTDGSVNRKAVIDAINANSALSEESITAEAGTEDTEIVVRTDLAETLTVSGTVGEESVTFTASSDSFFAGVAVFHQNSFKDSVGKYVAKDTVNVLEHGKIWVELVEDVEPKDGEKCYVTNGGLFTNTSDGNTEVGYFRSEVDNGLALAEIRGIKA